MSQDFAHVPVMANEVTDVLIRVPAGLVLDATVGGGGHATALLRARSDLGIIGLDRDEVAVGAATKALTPFGDRVRVIRGNFANMAEVVEALAPDGLSGVLFDLGVSSAQFDQAERGFSYRFDAPLDMRMDRRDTLSAADVINAWTVPELAAIFAANGEGRFSGRIARAIEAARPLRTTFELSNVVRSAIPAAARRTGGHPAKRVFQAVRTAVNNEIAVLGPALRSALGALVPGGRAVVLSYHSGEDRIVKDVFGLAVTGGCICPPGLDCVCGARREARHLVRGKRPGRVELEANPRASSARLRAVEKLEIES
ncbi:MAG: 16S rRNA (cytosine(1402)-N(4))-methyltransferase RsmH [Acidimicrobiales bacterium]